MTLRDSLPLSPASGDDGPKYGMFVDWAIFNLGYETTSGFRGRTDLRGGFSYREGDTVRFSIGQLLLGEALAAPEITVLQLVPEAVDVSDSRLVKMMQVLLTLSCRHEHTNAIHVPDMAHSGLAHLHAPQRLNGVANLEVEVVAKVFIAPRPAMVSTQAAMVLLAKALSTWEARRVIRGMPQVANIAVGGALKTCSSSNGAANCTKPWDEILVEDPAFAGIDPSHVRFDSERPEPAFTYGIDDERLAAWAKLPVALVRPEVREAIASMLRTRMHESPESFPALQFDDFDRHAWSATQADDRSPGDSVQSRLTDGLLVTEVAALRETFVDRSRAAHAQRQFELRSVAFLEDRDSVDIYSEFVRAATFVAGGRVPKVGLVTASADNPFNDRDVHYFALKSAGADVVWLPLSGGLRQAIDHGDTDNVHIHYAAFANTGSAGGHFHMDMLFPDLAQQQREHCRNGGAALNAQLQRLDGIFFSGGDQARHLESLLSRGPSGDGRRPSTQLQLLQERYRAGRMVVAGTSAGDAVQSGGTWQGRPVPMIGGGESLAALSKGFAPGRGPAVEGSELSGTFYRQGGLGFFQFGPLDSHFSIRAREGRLVRLVVDSGLHYGFGVDENTALIVGLPCPDGNTTMTVMGEGGVFIVDARNAACMSASGEPFDMRGARIHYVTAGDTMVVDSKGDLSVSLVRTKPQFMPNASSAPVRREGIQDYGSANFLRMMMDMGTTGASSAQGSTRSLSASLEAEDFDFRVTRISESDFRGLAGAGVSYTNLALQIGPSQR